MRNASVSCREQLREPPQAPQAQRRCGSQPRCGSGPNVVPAVLRSVRFAPSLRERNVVRERNVGAVPVPRPRVQPRCGSGAARPSLHEPSASATSVRFAGLAAVRRFATSVRFASIGAVRVDSVACGSLQSERAVWGAGGLRGQCDLRRLLSGPLGLLCSHRAAGGRACHQLAQQPGEALPFGWRQRREAVLVGGLDDGIGLAE